MIINYTKVQNKCISPLTLPLSTFLSALKNESHTYLNVFKQIQSDKELKAQMSLILLSLQTRINSRENLYKGWLFKQHRILSCRLLIYGKYKGYRNIVEGLWLFCYQPLRPIGKSNLNMFRSVTKFWHINRMRHIKYLIFEETQFGVLLSKNSLSFYLQVDVHVCSYCVILFIQLYSFQQLENKVGNMFI